MKCKIPEISWHNRDPVLSVDIQPKMVGNNTYRLASGGTDSHVLIWYLSLDTDIELDLVADLTRHQRAVNVVKWSPNGELLASGDDESVVFIWKQKADTDPLNILDSTNEQDKEVWITLKVLRGHMEDIYDLSWSPNSQFLVSGSVDNTAIIWDVHKGKSLAILSDHKGFVQGVAWDPKNQFIATLSTDRYLRIFDIQTKRVLHRVNKGTLPVPAGHELHGRRMRLYHDDTLQTFFRRLCFTPDGKLLLTPAGVTDYDGVTHPLHTTYAFSRYAFRQPALVLPCSDQYTVAVRCCPQLFCLRPHNSDVNPPVVPLPYRMIFAVATRSSVYFYDTQQPHPFAFISNIHYTRLTDITWSRDGRIVVVSSTDGFCSLITFEEGELGEQYADAEAVLGTAVAKDTTLNVKKSKKLKENKSSTDEIAMKTNCDVEREPLQENVRIHEEVQLMDASTAEKHETAAVENKFSAATLTLNNTLPLLTTGVVIPAKTLSGTIIIDKEILSSDEKFESPEKKAHKATPIVVRRQPRTPNQTNNMPSNGQTQVASTKSKTQITETIQKQINSPRQSTNRATPIAIRRTPRAIAVAKSASIMQSSSSPQDALGICPIDEERSTNPNVKLTTDTSVEIANLSCNERIDEKHTEDGDDKLTQTRTVQKLTEDMDQMTPAATINTPKQNQLTPNNKTPRRVALKTISTPKSKKKLLD